MKIKFSLSLEKVSNFLKKYYFWILGLILLVLLCLNAFVYYQYVYLTMNARVVPADGKIVIDQEIIEKVMDVIEEREENLTRVKTKDYFNPFND